MASESSSSPSTPADLSPTMSSSTVSEDLSGGKKKRKHKVRLEPPKWLDEMTVKLKKKAEGEYRLLAPGTPFDEIDLSEVDFLNHHEYPATKLKTWKAWLFGRKFWFPLGIVLGLLISAYTFHPAFPPDLIDSISGEVGKGMSMPDLSNLFSSMSIPWLDDFNFRDVTSNISIIQDAKKMWFSRDFKPGLKLRTEEGLTVSHPVILMPGIVSSGLESWSADTPEARSFFRKRLWGTSTMIQAIVSDKAKWIEAISLDPVTGLDPPKYKVRAAQGLDAASEFIQGYWVWLPIIQNLGALGGDLNNVDMAAYDWRLAYYNLEIRDAYFTRLKHKIEMNVKIHGKKVVLVSHSMGATVMLYFMKWVEADPNLDVDGMGFGGGGGPTWVEDHIDSWANIAGTLLGVTKSLSAHLSGEMKDVVELHPAAAYLLEKVFSRKERAALFRSWAGSASMWSKGGDRIWGNDEAAPDDVANTTDTYGRFFSFRDIDTIKDSVAENENATQALTSDKVKPNLTMSSVDQYVLQHTPPTFQRMMAGNYSNGFENDVEQLKKNAHDHRKWTNPLEVQLPAAPSMKIYCLYGHGKETERSYWYMQGDYITDESQSEATELVTDMTMSNDTQPGTSYRNPLDLPLSREHAIDTEVNNKEAWPPVRRGVAFGEGDGTVPLLSLGAMCARGWKDERWNPSGIQVKTREFKHQPVATNLRGGANT